MIKSLHFSLIVLLQPNSARFQPDHVYWDSKIFSLPYSKWTWKTVEKLKKIVASAWVWTHIILGKQKVDEFSPKTLPLSYGSILQILTAYYLYIKIWIFLYSILLIQLQESKNEAKMLISWKILAELSFIWCISTLYST